jgi:DNA-binding CsgD family transcriptional regulator
MMRSMFEGGLAQETLALAEALVQTRTSPGILVFNGSLQLLYMNQEARGLCARIIQAGSGYPATGVLPPDIAVLCEEMVAALRERPDPKDWEQGQVRRVAGDTQRPVLLRGVVVPSPGGSAEARVVVLMEEIGNRKAVAAARTKERFQLTDREQTVIIYLLKGLTNKQIASRLLVTEQTVKEHLKRIMRKTQTTTRTGLLVQILVGAYQPGAADYPQAGSENGAGAGASRHQVIG